MVGQQCGSFFLIGSNAAGPGFAAGMYVSHPLCAISPSPIISAVLHNDVTAG
jgi:hypothetical protein